MFEKPPCIHISISQKVNLGNYQSAEVSMSISHLPIEASEHEIQMAIETQRLTFDRMKVAMRDKIARIRHEGGFDGEMVEGDKNFEARV